MKVYLIIVNFNNSLDTNSCLQSLANIEKADLDLYVLVIDNSDKIKFKITDKNLNDLRVEVIDSGENLGFTGGNNLGIKKAMQNKADFIVVLNNDTHVDRNFLVNLVNGVGEGVGIAVPKIYYSKGSEYHKERYSDSDLGKIIWYAGGYIDWENVVPKHMGVDEVDNGKYNQKKEVEFATGCCMLLTRQFLEDVGYFDDKYFLYYEDADLSVRAKKKSYKIIFVPDSIVWHINAASSGGSGSGIQDYYVSRNRMYFGFKYASFKTKLALIRESIRLFINGRKPQKKGITDFYLYNLGRGNL